jgi:hypothetical protein
MPEGVVEPVAGEAVFELERFEWTTGERIEVEGRWLGVRGRRFVRPTLTLRIGGGERRALALLDHKPWDPGDERWLAAFTLDESAAAFEEAELAVAPGLEVVLPAPRTTPAPKQQGEPRKRYAARAPVAAPETTPVDERAERVLLEAELEEVRRGLERALSERDAALSAREALLGERERDAEVAEELDRVRAEHDRVVAAHDALVAAHEALKTEHAEAVRARDEALRELDRTGRARDEAIALRDDAIAAREAAAEDRTLAAGQRDAALAERDAAKHAAAMARLPKSSIYTSTARRTLLDRWMPRLIAIAVFIAFVIALALVLHH